MYNNVEFEYLVDLLDIVFDSSTDEKNIFTKIRKRFEVPEWVVKNSHRSNRLVILRGAVYYFLRKEGLDEKGYSFPRIGRMMGGRDHSTVMNGLGRFKELANEYISCSQTSNHNNP